jgi:hypothetical protein
MKGIVMRFLLTWVFPVSLRLLDRSHVATLEN